MRGQRTFGRRAVFGVARQEKRKRPAKLRSGGYLAGLPLAKWYHQLRDCVTVAVTEKRTKAEIDGLATALERHLS